MRIQISADLDYALEGPTDLLLHVEAAAIPEQKVHTTNIEISDNLHFARVPAQDAVGERIWLRAEGNLTVKYRATVSVHRIVSDCLDLPIVPPHQLPGETVQYLFGSRYCPSDQFQDFVDSQFGAIDDREKVIAMRDWIARHFKYVPGVSTSDTTAADTFIRRQGVCRDYAHVMITLARAAGVPARIASVYALGVEPQDFHAVAEVFLGGEWHLVDATGMATEAEMVKIGVGRDAADVAFLTMFGPAQMRHQSVRVAAASA